MHGGKCMPEEGRLIAVEGPSAAGKTTLVRRAARSLGWCALGEAFDRLDPVPSLEYGSSQQLRLLEGKLLAEEARRYREARRQCARGHTVLADTGFLGPITYTRGLVALDLAPTSVARSLERKARSLLQRGVLGIPDLTVYLDLSTNERRRRARADPDRHPLALFRRHTTVGRLERAYYVTTFAAALPDRFRTLSGRREPRTLVASLRAVVREVAPTPSTRAEALLLLSSLGPLPRAVRDAGGSPNR